VPSGEAFSDRDLREIGREVRALSEQAQIAFSVLVADPGQLSHDDLKAASDIRVLAEQAHAALGERSTVAVLVLVAPNAHRVEIVTGSELRGRLSDRDCALAALSMSSSFAGGDLAGGILQGMRMLAQRAGKPRRGASTVSPGRTLSSLLRP
jgi:uncharacterized membrane protein YgcG